jgi:DNA-directed RNA polymerase specialized sigma24 family protein
MTDRPEELKARAQRVFERVSACVPGNGDEPADHVRLARLERGLGMLPQATQQIFRAKIIDRFSYAHIARATGLSQRQVRRRMANALYHLRCCMDGDERTPRLRWWQDLWLRWHR